MELREIMAISGQPGLYKYIAQSRNGVIVESLIDGKRMNASSTSRVSTLTRFRCLPRARTSHWQRCLRRCMPQRAARRHCPPRSRRRNSKRSSPRSFPITTASAYTFRTSRRRYRGSTCSSKRASLSSNCLTKSRQPRSSLGVNHIGFTGTCRTNSAACSLFLWR